MRYPAALTIPIAVTRNATQPLHEQIAVQVGAAVDHGLLPRRSRLPSTRALADLLGVSRGVTAAAYDLLFTRGYLASEAGSGTYVAGNTDPMRRRPEPARPAGDSDTAIDLRPDQLNTEAYPLAAWRAAWRQASFRRPPAHPLPPLGVPELRRAVAEHLLATRGVATAGMASARNAAERSPTARAKGDKEIVITGGRTHGLRIVLDALGVYGSQVAVEEPAPPAVHRAAGDGPDRPASLPVDAEGARMEGIPASCRAIVVSPDAHVPLGSILSAQRRKAVAAWASGTGGHVIEMACDAVFRPDASRLPRLLTGGSSVLIGGFCELLTPALKLGYAVVPSDLAGVIGRRIRDRAEQPPYVTQLAVAELLGDGTVVRLMHRLGRLYAGKRRLLRPVLHRLRLATAYGMNTAVVSLPAGLVAANIAGQLRTHGVRVETLAPYRFSGRPAPEALVIGYGHQPDATLRHAMSILADVLARHGWRSGLR